MPCCLSAALIKVSETISGWHVEASRILTVVLLLKVSDVATGENLSLYFVCLFISDEKAAQKDPGASP